MTFWLVLGWLVAILALITTGMLVWYLLNLFKQVEYMSEDVEEIARTIRIYSKLLSRINGMEMYMGDPVITDFIEKTKIVSTQLKSFSDFILVEGETEENDSATTEEEE